MLVLLMLATPAFAQFGFFPDTSHHRHRNLRRPVRPMPPPADEREVPMPVPRPSFLMEKPPAAPQPTAKPALPKPAVSKPALPNPTLPNPTPPGAPSAAQPAKAPSTSPPAPGIAPSGARLGEAPGQPEDDASCPARLKARGVDVETIDIGSQPDARCTVVQAVRLSGLALPGGTRIDFPDSPHLACVTAETFAHYVQDLLSPLAKGTYGAAVASVWTGPGLECRSRDHVVGAKLSAHGQGLAVDIAQVKLADGRMITVGETKDPTDEAFQTASRAGACGFFHTALGPGTDSYHRNHWHFDLEVRGAHGDSKYCR